MTINIEKKITNLTETLSSLETEVEAIRRQISTNNKIKNNNSSSISDVFVACNTITALEMALEDYLPEILKIKGLLQAYTRMSRDHVLPGQLRLQWA